MATDEILRLHYYERQYLGAADLEDQQTYLRDMRRRHNVGQHTWGIVTGLDLVEVPVPGDPTAVLVFIQPGMATDGFGREIIVMAPVQLEPALFASFNDDNYHAVWISYDQVQAQPPTGGFAQCDVSNQFSRIQETYKIEVDPNPPAHIDVSVNGQQVNPKSTNISIPADDSVPYQEFPDDSIDPTWLLQLGSVHWDGSPGQVKFKPATPHTRLSDGRAYVGVVAQNVYGPAPEPLPDPNNPNPVTDLPTFFIQPRFPLTDSTTGLPTPDAVGFAEIMGRLQVDGRITAEKDVLLNGSKLQFLDTAGSDDKIPLWMQRTPGDGGVGTDLHVHIDVGPDPTKADQNRLSVGFTSGAAEQTVFAVTAGNKVNIPTGSLNFGNSPLRQMLNLWNADYGIGVQDWTLYFRSDSDFCWFIKGSHSNNQDDPGPGGTLAMKIDSGSNLSIPAGDIYFGAQTRQMLNLWQTNYGIGVQGATLYFRSDSDFCWFIKGTHSDTQDNPGAGGTLAMKIDSGSNLSLSGSASVGGSLWVASNLSIGGNLNVTGSQNIFNVFTQTLALSLNGQTTPRPWTVYYPAFNFSQVYAAFVVFQGFSIWGNEGNTNFSNWSNDPDVNAIPQHAYARVINFNNTQASGEVFCSESLASNETDNTVLFTVVVMGRS